MNDENGLKSVEHLHDYVDTVIDVLTQAMEENIPENQSATNHEGFACMRIIEGDDDELTAVGAVGGSNKALFAITAQMMRYLDNAAVARLICLEFERRNESIFK